MPTKLVIPNEISPGERRIALEPGVAKKLVASGPVNAANAQIVE